MKFKINDKVSMKLNDKQKKLVRIVKDKLEKNKYTQDSLHNEFYNIIKENNFNTEEFFELFYGILISKERGPKLSSLILEVGVKKVIELLNQIK